MLTTKNHLCKILYIYSILIIYNLVSSSSLPKVTLLEKKEPFPLLGAEGRDELRLQCEVEGNPTPTISWFFNGTAISKSHDGRFRTSRSKTLMRIFEVEEKDSGYYRCVATNTMGSTFNELTIKIRSMGFFSIGNELNDPKKIVKAKLNTQVNLTCPGHTKGIGDESYWGVLPNTGKPTLWSNGEPEPLVFLGEQGELIFSSLTQNHVNRINMEMDGISCILYQMQITRVSAKTKIEVIGKEDKNYPPKLYNHIQGEEIAIEGEGYSLVCGSIGRPHPKVTWYKDEEEIIVEPGKKTIANAHFVYGTDMELKFVDVVKENGGKYKCLSKNSLGEDSKKATLVIHVRPKWTKELKEEFEFTYGDRLKIEAIGEGVPALEYEWYFNGSKIQNSENNVLIDGSTLEYPAADMSHGGLYMCVARNYLGVVVTATFVVIQAIPPSFTKELPNTSYFFKGYDNELQCIVEGGPKPSKAWRINDTVDDTNDRISVVEGKLKLRNAAYSDAGKYTCLARNLEGYAESHTKVKVVEKTVITKPPSDIAYPIGYPMAQLFCVATFDTKLDVTFEWLKDGKPMEDTDRVYKERRLSGPRLIVFFKELRKSDAGQYSCRVYTMDEDVKVSEDIKIGSLTVIDNPDPPTNVKLTGDCGSSASLTWTESKEYGAPVKFYRVEYASVDDTSKWYRVPGTVATDDLAKEIKYKDLPPAANLIFRVLAYAFYKYTRMESKPSEATSAECVIPVGAPLVNPSNVRGQVDGKGKLTVVWDQLDDIHRKVPIDYVVKYRKLPDGEEKEVVVKGDENKFIVPDPGTKEKYEVYVQTTNSEGSGPEPEKVILTSGEEEIPGQVGNLKGEPMNATAVSLSWDLVDNAATYKVFWKEIASRRRRDNHKSYHSEIVTGNSINITSLNANTKYEFTVAAENSNGIGEKSAELIIEMPNGGAPGMPSDVTFQIIGDTVRMRWKAPKSGNTAIKKYEIRYYKTDEKPPTRHVMELDDDARQAFVKKDLESMTYYSFELVAISDDDHEGEPYVMEGIVVGHPDKPGKPGEPLVESVNASIINVTFVIPDDYRGGMPDKYNIYYEKQEESRRRKRDNHVSSKLTYDYPVNETVEIDSLNLGAYLIRTSGQNDFGESVKSDAASIKLIPPPPLEKEKILVPHTTSEGKKFYEELWFFILILILLLLLLLFLICCVCCTKRGSGQYHVSVKEKEKGGWESQPLKDYAMIPMSDTNGIRNSPALKKQPMRNGSNNSVGKRASSRKDTEDLDSLDEYGDDNKFKEDGSFIGEYGDEETELVKGTTLV